MLPAWATVLIAAISANAGILGAYVATRIRIDFDPPGSTPPRAKWLNVIAPPRTSANGYSKKEVYVEPRNETGPGSAITFSSTNSSSAPATIPPNGSRSAAAVAANRTALPAGE